MTAGNIKPFVFVLMPFDPSFNDIYELGIRDACQQADAYAERVDQQTFDGTILARIYNQIAKADLIISDMTGKNPNVFYEVGYAHALKKRVLLLTQNKKDIPFDLIHYPHIIYDPKNISELRKTLIPNIIPIEIRQSLTARELCAFPYGLGEDKVARKDCIFQDFNLTRDREGKANVNAIQCLWADSYCGSKVDAEVHPGGADQQCWLRVSFDNEASSYPCSVSIRGMKESPLEKPESARFLSFEVRLPPNGGPERVDSNVRVAVSVRVVNGWLQHWVYGEGPETFFQHPVKSVASLVKVDLHHPSMWHRFMSEGNPSGPSSAPPDFSFIASVVLEVGMNRKESRLKEGRGALEIGPIFLAT